MVDNGAPEVAPATLHVMGEELQVFADAVPDQYPLGLEVVVFRPGGLEPIARMAVPPGRMGAVLPQSWSSQLRAMIQKAKTLLPGQVDAPGVKT